MSSQNLKSFSKDILMCLLQSAAVGLASMSLFAVVIILTAPLASASQEIDEPTVRMSDVQNGSLLFRTSHRNRYVKTPALNTSVEIDITAMMARVKVSQSFRNQGQDWVEGVYVFPLPENAAVDRMRMKVGERIIEGQIKERKEAKRIYTTAKKAGKKASLIEQERANIFTNSIANIGPGETITIDIEYQQTLRYDHQTFSIRFPMVIAPRYIPGNTALIEETLAVSEGIGWATNTDQVTDASRITPPVIEHDKPQVNPVAIQVNLNAGIPLSSISSLYHRVDIEQGSNGKASIELSGDSIPADRDFVLEWKPTPSHAPRAALFSEPGKNGYYSLIMVMPPVIESGIELHLPREVTFIIDTSGSMGGTSIRQARAALKMAIDRLKPTDYFDIVEFNSTMNPLFGKPVQATYPNRNLARLTVDQLRAGGGTVIAPALQHALDTPANNQLIQQIVFLTDGSVGNESALFKLIEDRLGDKRLFTVGIGSAPNSHFMKRAAAFGRGSFTYIGKLSEVSEKMLGLFSRLETPAMSHLQLRWPADMAEMDVYPERLPDLYAGEPLLISTSSASLTGELEITGRRGQQPWSARLPLRTDTTQKGVGVLWARSRIASLMNKIHRGSDREKIKASIIKTALDHHLVSKYTSLVAVDVTPSRPAGNHLKQSAIPTNLPAGWQRHKVFGSIPTTATAAELHRFIGSILLLLSGLIWGFWGPIGRFSGGLPPAALQPRDDS